MNLLFLILALIFSGVILVLGWIENYKKKGYNMPVDEDVKYLVLTKKLEEHFWKYTIQPRIKWKYKHVGD